MGVSLGNWIVVESRKVGVNPLDSPPSATSGITSEGKVYSLLQFPKLVNDKVETEILSIHRSLDKKQPAEYYRQQFPLLLRHLLQPRHKIYNPLQFQLHRLRNNDPKPKINRNMIGLVLVIVVVVFLLLFLLPGRGQSNRKAEK